MAATNTVYMVEVVWQNEDGETRTERYGSEARAMERMRELREHFNRQPYMKGVRVNRAG